MTLSTTFSPIVCLSYCLCFQSLGIVHKVECLKFDLGGKAGGGWWWMSKNLRGWSRLVDPVWYVGMTEGGVLFRGTQEGGSNFSPGGKRGAGVPQELRPKFPNPPPGNKHKWPLPKGQRGGGSGTSKGFSDFNTSRAVLYGLMVKWHFMVHN